MSINYDDLIGQEVNRIIKSKNDNLGIDYDVTIHTPIGDVFVTMLETIEINSDYNNNFTSVIYFNFIMAGGYYRDYIIANSGNLEATITKFKKEEILYTETFKAILVNTDSDISEYKGNYKTENLNRASMVRGTIMLLSREIEIMRGIKVDGVFTSTSVKKVLTYLFSKAKEATINSIPIDLTVNIEEPHNDNVYDHIVIPTGVGYLDAPTFLQDTEYGVYNGDIGLFIKRQLNKDKENKLNLFTFPLYTVNKNPKKELFIYHSNNPYYDFVENTYTVLDNILKIVSTSEIVTITPNENKNIDSGNAITSSDPYKLTDYNASVTNDKISYDKSNQVTSMEPGNRSDGMNIENYVGNEANLYKVRSKINLQHYGHFQIRWNHSAPELLIPGMAVKFFYQKENEIKILVGRLQRDFSLYSEATKTISTMLNILLKEEDGEN